MWTCARVPGAAGRDLDKIRQHVRQAEESYLVTLGAKRPHSEDATAEVEWPVLRETIAEVVTRRARDEPLRDPNKVRNPWSARYFVRRAAWHVLDHAWEIEDRAAPASGPDGGSPGPG